MSQPHSAFPYTGTGPYTGVDGVTDDEKKKETTPDGLAPSSDDQPTTCHGEFDLEKRGSGGDDRKELLEPDCYDRLGFSFPTWKKWTILSVIFAAQVSMNFNAGFYASGVSLLSSHFGISKQAARVGQMDFLVAYGFGSEFWAPWSEEYGRWPVMQLSLLLVNIWQIPCALAPNFGTIVVCRILGGLSSAGGSVTLGMVADMWEAEDQQYAVAFIVFASVAGSVIAPVVGGFAEAFLDWHWNFWLQLILGGFAQLLHFFVPETRCSILLTREARRRRRNGETVYSADELKGTRISIRHLLMVWSRPFVMFVREPIVLCLSMLSGFSDSLIFTFLQSFTPVYEQWGFNTVTIGLAFLP